MTLYMSNQTQLAKKFGISYEEMDRILIEYELIPKRFWIAISLVLVLLESLRYIPKLRSRSYGISLIFIQLWLFILIATSSYLIRYFISDLFWDKLYRNSGDFWFGMMAATHAFDGIPEAMRNDVHKRIDRELIGDRRPAFEKCGRLTFFRANGFCWRCLPDDTFKQQRLNYEVEAREAAAQLATSGWGTLHADNRLEPTDTDIELWNGAIDIAIDAFLVILADPSKIKKLTILYSSGHL